MNRVERLEGRTLFASYAAASATELIASMTQANSSAEADTITLPAGATFTLTAVDNGRFGPTGLPSITEAGGGLTILGNGSTIERSSAAGTPVFRLFDVDINALLTLSPNRPRRGDAGTCVGEPGLPRERRRHLQRWIANAFERDRGGEHRHRSLPVGRGRRRRLGRWDLFRRHAGHEQLRRPQQRCRRRAGGSRRL